MLNLIFRRNILAMEPWTSFTLAGLLGASLMFAHSVCFVDLKKAHDHVP